MIKFRQKSFSNYIITDTIKGAGIGASLGTLSGSIGIPELSSIIPGAKAYNNLKTQAPSKWDKNDKEKVVSYKDTLQGKINQGFALTAAGTILGAALGALVGTAREIGSKISQSKAGESRLSKALVDRLGATYRQDKDFTLDPKVADRLKIRVCIVITKDASNLQIRVNAVDDKHLNVLVDRLTRDIKNSSRVFDRQQTSNKFNDIIVTTASNSITNVAKISKLVSDFIEAGYPVYIVEVG